jgi:NADH-quinone oxidoreductase subunit J
MLTAYYLLGLGAVLGALPLLIVRNPVYCALSLVASFGAMAGIFILLNQEFVAAIQILIYAGAIMVLFLFVIMLLNLRSDAPFAIQWTVPKAIGGAVTVGILAQLLSAFFSAAARPGPAGDYPPERIARDGAVQIVGDLLFKDYVLPFEVISVLLLVAVMGAVVLAKRRLDSPRKEGR